MKLFLPVLRADFTLLETYDYVAQAPIDLPVTAFAGSDDPVVSPSEMAGWKDITSASFDFQIIPGGHFFLQTNPGRVLEIISETIVKF
jgi:surfactin synthase thioesterase subunit